MPSLCIHPLHLGTITRQKMAFYYWLEPGRTIDVPLIAWYIEGSDKKILVDTGGGDPSEADPALMPYKRKVNQSIENALKNLGLSCEDIDIVIVTHLHWDHSAGNSLFPKAEIFVQEEELQAARKPFPVIKHGYIKSIVEDIDYTVISGDKEIADGIKVLLIPGHTYGLQGVLVECKTQRYFIASDTFGYFKNLETDPPMISGIFVDLKQYYRSIEKISKLSAFILPGHDPKVFDKEIYS
ncbi:N-acyl homoserine lactonase family protein [Thermodesulfobacteriota bacterium]